jgi:acetyl esterase/lipase
MTSFVRMLGGALLLVLTGCTAPGLLNSVDGISGGGKAVTRVAEGVAFGTHGQKLDVWRPEGPADDAAGNPVVIFWYGGGWADGKRQDYGFAARAFAAEGFTVVLPDYRKVPDVRYPAFLEDGAQALAWTRANIAQYGGDPQRIGVSGHSAGAYIAVMLALDPRWNAAAGVPDGTIKAGVGLSGPYDFYPFDQQRAIDAFGQASDPKDTQPINHVSGKAPPLLLVTSTDDTLVRPYNTENLAKALSAAGATVETKTYPGLTHEEVAMALSATFRGKGPVLQDSAAFLKAQMP